MRYGIGIILYRCSTLNPEFDRIRSEKWNTSWNEISQIWKGYTLTYRICNSNIRKELHIFKLKNKLTQYKVDWYLVRMDLSPNRLELQAQRYEKCGTSEDKEVSATDDAAYATSWRRRSRWIGNWSEKVWRIICKILYMGIEDSISEFVKIFHCAFIHVEGWMRMDFWR